MLFEEFCKKRNEKEKKKQGRGKGKFKKEIETVGHERSCVYKISNKEVIVNDICLSIE